MAEPVEVRKENDPQGVNHNLPKSEYTHVIAMVHGIRDIGAWQGTVSSELMMARGIQVVQIRYGMFSAWRFLFPLPIFFKRPTEKVVDGLRNLRNEYPNAKLSVIAHSFGTFLTLRALRKDPLIQLWKIVFCGSVADDLGDWSALRQRVGDNHLPTKEFIVNDCGTGDTWPVLGTALGWHFGMAGSVGFSEEYVTNRFHRGRDASPGGHSLYFDPKFISEKWKPFLIEDAPILSGDGRQGEHLPWLTRALYFQAAQWLVRLTALAVWLAIPFGLILLTMAYFPLGKADGLRPKSKAKTIRIGMKQWVGYTPLAVAKQLKLFPSEVDVEFVNVGSVEEMGIDLANGDIELAMGLVETHVRECEKYIGDEGNPNRPVALLKLDTSRGADGIVARAGIESMADLGLIGGEERKFVYQHHDVSGYLFRHLCKESGVDFRDFKQFRLNAKPEDAARIFATDPDFYAAGTYEPYLTYIRTPGNSFYVEGAHLLLHSDMEGVKGSIVDIMFTKAKYAEEFRSEIENVMIGWFRAVKILTDDSHELNDEAIEIALQFNGTTRDTSDWNAVSWMENKPCTKGLYLEMLEGLRGLHRPEKQLAWANRKENIEFFRRLGSEPSDFHDSFNHCKELRAARSLKDLDVKPFDASGIVLDFPYRDLP